MKTLFALLTGAALGTLAALWLAARSLRDQAAAAQPEPESADTITEVPALEEAPA